MKKQSTASFIQMSNLHLQNLTTIVDETIATRMQVPENKVFTVADLWNTQRQAKINSHRRLSF